MIYQGRETTAALTAPSVPAAVSEAILGINGLQPGLKAHELVPASLPVVPFGFLRPQTVARYYDAEGIGFDGSGQTIAIMWSAAPDPNDLVAFWAACGSPHTLADYQVVNPGWSQGVSTTDPTAAAEGTCDVEWASAMAPGAKIRYYETVDPAQFSAQILADLPTNPGLHQASLSEALPEDLSSPDAVQSQSQYFAALTAAGVTVFAGSGDGGSNPSLTGLPAPDPSAPLSTENPASDPNVIAVGGTDLVTAQSTNVTGEVAEPLGGGGLSTIFSRPAWQVGTGLPPGTARCVPDVSAIFSGTGAFPYAYFGGTAYGFAGTSLSTPVWAGLCALINQARTAASLPPLGQLGPKIYPLNGTAAFNDITQGSNGAYSAGVGYDLCTGLGTPNVAALINALAGASLLPIRGPFTTGTTPGGSAVFSVTVSGSAVTGYQWQTQPAAGGAWTSLTDSSVYSGSGTANLTVSNVAVSLDGTNYRCQVTSGAVTVPSLAATLNVETPPQFTQRFADQSAAPGSTVTFQIAATGTHLLYTWTDPHNRRIVTSDPSLTLTNVDSSESGTYSVYAYNDNSTFLNDAAQSVGLLTVTGPPTFTQQPPAMLVADVSGNRQLLAVQAWDANVVGIAYVWQVEAPGTTVWTNLSDGGIYSGTHTGGLYLAPTTDISGTSYRCSATDSFGTSYSTVTVVTSAAVAPSVTAQPASELVNPGASANFVVAASGTQPLTYQWQVSAPASNTWTNLADGNAVQGSATNALLLLDVAGTANNYRYRCVVSNSGGTADSAAATLTVLGFSVPAILSEPTSESVTAGGAAVLSVVADGATSYQWYSSETVTDGTGGSNVKLQAVAGATGSTLTLPNAQWTDAGDYVVLITNAIGSTISTAATVSVQDGHLANLSVRGDAGVGQNALIAGFVTGGVGTKPVVVRGIGPALASFGVSDFLSNPQLTLDNSQGATLATNAGWGGASALLALFTQVGAFALPASSADSALSIAVGSGNYSAAVSGLTGMDGVALAEIYDADPAGSPRRLMNLSARGRVGATSDLYLTAGFVVGGPTPEKVLVRAVGPGLAAFGLGSLLAVPQLTLFNSTGILIETTVGWGGSAQLSELFSQVGAFPLSPSSADCAVVLTLTAGNYTAQVSGANGSTGQALVEIYEIK